MRDALLYVGLCCGEIACVGLACSWLAFPAVVELTQHLHIYRLWLLSSIIGGPVAAGMLGHWIFQQLD